MKTYEKVQRQKARQNRENLEKFSEMAQLIGFETLDTDILRNAAFAVYDPTIYLEPVRMKGRNLKAVLAKVNILANEYKEKGNGTPNH